MIVLLAVGRAGRWVHRLPWLGSVAVGGVLGGLTNRPVLGAAVGMGMWFGCVVAMRVHVRRAQDG
jgi:hypothetical protein